MCICINCRHMKICNIYHFIQKQHNYNKNGIEKNSRIYFNPIDTTISVSLYTTKALLDWDLKECSSFIEKPGNWFQENL
uniref:Ycf34 n=1 Tax=Polysiphonia sertularioides TaxID=945028 RepID=A0A1Z1M8Q2_9FLOR|nr:hypothetical protein [Polysiphonia sertularioides]ARW62458.1 hypothetical protein [Polysiphonia sertularioides]